MRFALSLMEYESIRIIIYTPFVKDMLGKVKQSFSVRAAQPYDRHRPFYYAGLNVFKARDCELFLYLCARHGKLIVSALVMVVAQYAASYYRQICIRTDEIVREQRHEVEQIAERLPVYMHRDVLFIEDYAVLVIVNIRTVLQEEIHSAQTDRDHPVVLSCRMIEPAFIPLVLRAKQALRVAGSLCLSRCRYGFRILFGLRQIDGYVYRAVLRIHGPLAVLCDPVPSYVIRITGKLIVPVCRFPRRDPVSPAEFLCYLGRPRYQQAHQSGVEQIEICCGIAFDHTVLISVSAEPVQYLLNGRELSFHRHQTSEAVHLKRLEYPVGCPDPVRVLKPTLPDCIFDKL